MSLLDASRIVEPQAYTPCPLCGEEWNRMRSCVYWLDGAEMVAQVCPPCAETVSGLEALLRLYPLSGALLTLKNVFEGGHRVYHSERAFIAYESLVFRIDSTGTKLRVFDGSKPAEDPKFYDNTFNVWMAIRHRIEKGENPAEGLESSWGSPRGKGRRSMDEKRKESRWAV